MMSSAGADVPADLDLIKLSLFYGVDAPDDRLDELAERLRKQELIEAAYVKPPILPAGAIHDEVAAKTFVELQEAKTPDFSDGQIYLNAAPEGIDARYAWTVPGGVEKVSTSSILKVAGILTMKTSVIIKEA